MIRRRPPQRQALALAALCCVPLWACAEGGAFDLDAEYGMYGPLEPTPPPGKFDSQNRRGLWVNTDTSRTQVWSAKNAWEDRDTPAAREAGLAWGEDSGLNWDEKYARWIGSMERISGASGFETFQLTTPWGKTLESPALECAEMTIFLRVSFAAWYQLPWFMEAVDGQGRRVYFGHNGIRTAQGRYANTPEYGVRYADFSNLSPAEYQQSWPEDTQLRSRRLFGGDDAQPMLGSGAVFGEYADEIHLNKRVGHFLLLTLNYLGSVNLADTSNTYNIVPEAVRPGDSLLERWQRRGIGHTLVVKEVVPLGEGALDVALVSGSMPRRQAKWESGVRSKQYFTDERTGGEGENFDGEQYSRLGGGLKRWRVTKNIDGFWTNTWMSGDEAHWINSNDFERIAARPEQFERILGQIDPADARDGLLEGIEDARGHLRNFPASCAARERRERAFAELYDLMAREFDTTRVEVDRQFRTAEDYVFGALEYDISKTCCWNSTTSDMYQIVMEYAARERAAAEAEGMCVAPTVFMNHTDGYERWRQLADELGRGAQWVAWTEDEPCSQRSVTSDTVREPDHTEFCQWQEAADDGGGDSDDCSDAHEPNESQSGAPALGGGTAVELTLCDGDTDWFAVAAGGVVTIEFTHAVGDLDMEAVDASGQQVDSSTGTTDREQVTVPVGGAVRIYGYLGATGPYQMTVE